MRLFVSIDVSDLAPDIADIQTQLAEASGVRLTDPDQVHVTLKFLGETDSERVPNLKDELAAAVATSGVSPFDARFGGLGVFPHLDYISVIWLGVQAGGEQLTALHEHIEDRTTAMGFDPEEHEFTPHATLARMNHAGGKEHVQAVVSNTDPVAGEMRIDEVRLTESVLREDGPEYTTVKRFPLSE